MHPLSLEGLSLLPERGLKGSKFSEGVYWKRGGYIFEQGEGGIAVFT